MNQGSMLLCLIGAALAAVVSANWQSMSVVKDCPLETHPDTNTMFVMRGPLGNPEPRVCPPATIFQKSLCGCIHKPEEKCNLRASPNGPQFYEVDVFDTWIEQPCGPGTAYNPSSCDCSLFI